MTNAAVIIAIVWFESGSYPAHLIIKIGTKIDPKPYTASTTKANTESPPGTYNPKIEIDVANAATIRVTNLAFLWS